MILGQCVGDQVAGRAQRLSGQPGTDDRLLDSIHAQVNSTDLAREGSRQRGFPRRGQAADDDEHGTILPDVPSCRRQACYAKWPTGCAAARTLPPLGALSMLLRAID